MIQKTNSLKNLLSRRIAMLQPGKLNLYGLAVISLLAIFVMAGSGCANKKKLTKEEPKEVQDSRIATAKDKLLQIINDDGSIPLEEKERIVNEIIAMNLNDPEINRLIAQAQAAIDREKKALEEQQKEPVEEALPVETVKDYHITFLQGKFDEISVAGDYTEARNMMDEVMKLFENENVPVLIGIIEQNGMVDYDRPTTIRKYMEFLMDQNKNLNRVKEIKYNDNGKIIELELIKE